MASPSIRIKRSAIAGKVPHFPSQIDLGEFAINTADGKVFIAAGTEGVGIGTTVPEEKLYVSGNLKVDSGNVYVSGNLGCHVDVVAEVDRKCSGRPSCFFLVSELDHLSPCQADLKSYLEARYTCQKGQNGALPEQKKLFNKTCWVGFFITNNLIPENFVTVWPLYVTLIFYMGVRDSTQILRVSDYSRRGIILSISH